MSRSTTALIAATAIVLPSLSQFATAAKPASKTTSSKQSTGSKKLSSKKAATKQKAAANYQVQMEDCDLNTDGRVDVTDIMMVISEYGNDCTTADCTTDVNRDQSINTRDLLAVLSNYGTLPVAPAPETLLSGVRACLQSQFSQDASGLRNLGVENNSWMVMGSALAASNNMSEDAFFATSASDIEHQFGRYLANQSDLNSDFDGTLVLDIEYPFNPSQLGKFINPDSSSYDPIKFDTIVDAFKLRVAVVREMMPNCKLGLYGFPTPHPHGKLESNSEQERIMGYEMAAARGILDQVDVICPVIYQRFGQTDNKYNRIAAYTVNGIQVGHSLRRTDGTALEVQPLVSFKVYNGGSAHHMELVEISDLADQIEVIRAEGVEEFMFWSGQDNLTGSSTITDRLADLLEELDYRSNDVMVASAR